MKYIKNDKDQIKTIVVSSEEHLSNQELRNLSTNSKAKVYSLPEKTDIELDSNGWLVSARGNVDDIWMFMLGWAMPYQCFVNGFPFPVNMDDMWVSTEPVQKVPLNELKWNLDYPWWNKFPKSYYDLKPHTVLQDIDQFDDHRDRILTAEIKYPLSLIETKQHRWLIYDGMHRYVKQTLDDKDEVLCKRFSIEDVGKYVKSSHEVLFSEWKVLEYR